MIFWAFNGEHSFNYHEIIIGIALFDELGYCNIKFAIVVLIVVVLFANCFFENILCSVVVYRSPFTTGEKMFINSCLRYIYDNDK